MDGESYFKRKEVPRALREASYNYSALMQKEAIFECEGPSKHMYHFSGLLTHGRDTIFFDNDNFLLSGASLKNTDWIIGLVVYTGHETKIMMNSRTSSLKMSSYDDKIQNYLIFNILAQILICAFLATCFVVWLGKHPIYEIVDPARHNKPLLNWFLNFMSWMLLMT